jgi:hypothetical protein
LETAGWLADRLGTVVVKITVAWRDVTVAVTGFPKRFGTVTATATKGCADKSTGC